MMQMLMTICFDVFRVERAGAGNLIKLDTIGIIMDRIQRMG